MSEPNITFHDLEDYNFMHTRLWVHVILQTERFGLLQVKYTNLNDGNWKLETFPQEPNLQMFSQKQHLRIEYICRIVWRMVYDAPAATDRFQ